MIPFLSWFFQPDSVFATERLAKGDYEAIPSLLKNSLKRAIFIAPGVLIAGIRGKQAVVASVLGSLGVSLSLVVYFITTPDYTTDLCSGTKS